MNAQRLVDSFIRMVGIASPSRHEAAMAAFCEAELKALGFEVYRDHSQDQTGSETGNIIAHLPGTTAGAVAFCAHLDTVSPCEGIEVVTEKRLVSEMTMPAAHAQTDMSIDAHEDGVIEVLTSAGDTILSADDKAGIAAIFEGVRSLLESGAAYPDIDVVLTTCEELSLLGSRALPDNVFASGEHCFVLDADGAPGSIIVGAPCHYSVRATFMGRAAHAGVEPQAGVNALVACARAIDKMELGRLDAKTTANVGIVEGGVAINIVPDRAVLEGECRSLDFERANQVKDAMHAALEQAAQEVGAHVDITWNLDYPPILFTSDDPLVQKLSRAMTSIGLVPHEIATGGGADANCLGEKGARAITLGTGMTNFHSKDEYIAVRDLEAMARLVEALALEYASGEYASGAPGVSGECASHSEAA